MYFFNAQMILLFFLNEKRILIVKYLTVLLLISNMSIGQTISLEQSCTAEIYILDENQLGWTPNVKVSKFENAFEGLPTAPQLKANYLFSDEDRLYVQVTDLSRFGAGSISANFSTYDVTGDLVSSLVNLQLYEMSTSLGTFRSNPILLVSNQVDDNENPMHVNVIDYTKIYANSLEVKIGGKITAEYDIATGNGPLPGSTTSTGIQSTICESVKTINIRGFILRDQPQVDGGTAVAQIDELTEAIAVANTYWAQCCIAFNLIGPVTIIDPPSAEPFLDYGLDGEPGTGDTGEGNGVFDYRDWGTDGEIGTGDIREGDLLHHHGEPAEPYTNINGNDGYDREVDLIDGGNGGLDLVNSLVNFSGFRTWISNDSRNLFDTHSDEHERTIEIYVINRMRFVPPGFVGYTYSEDADGVGNYLTKKGNSIVITTHIPNSGLHDNTLAHEIGHVLIGPGHPDQAPVGSPPGTPDPPLTVEMYINLMKANTDPNVPEQINSAKRLNSNQSSTANSF